MINRNNTLAYDTQRILDSKGEFITQVSEFIQPCIEIKRLMNIVRSSSTAASGAVTVYTTPADKDFYLCSASLSLMKDAANDTATAGPGIVVIIEGVSQTILRISTLTATAHNETITQSFDPPIKIDRNTAISNTLTFTAGNLHRGICIQGYTVETTKGV